MSKNNAADDAGFKCDVNGCDNTIVGLDDGWEFDRGYVCRDCIDYHSDHHHWPDEDPDLCRQCILDDGGEVHDCENTDIDVILEPGDACPECGFELAVTDGGVDRDDAELHHLGGGLMNAKATLEGEADELAHRRPHPDAHLYDVESGLRHAAGEAEDMLTRWYYER